jgi:hypothetical protein
MKLDFTFDCKKDWAKKKIEISDLDLTVKLNLTVKEVINLDTLSEFDYVEEY